MAASRHQGSQDDRGKVRLRYMEVEVEGSNHTLLESIRQITSAIPAQKVVVRQLLPTDAVPTGGHVEGADVEPVSSQDSEVVTADVEATDDGGSSEPPAKRQRNGSRPSKPPPLAPDLNVEDGPMPLRTFCETTNVTNASPVSDKAIAIATWLREHRNRSMGPSEFYTCCKFLDWSRPTDPTQPMRNLKRDNKLASGEESGTYVLTMLGEKHFRELRRN